MDLRRYGMKPYVIISMVGVLIYAVVGIVLIIIADDNWRFGVDCLSDFGISSNPVLAFGFNGSCILCGFLISFLGIGKILFENEKLNKISGLALIIGSIAMIVVGIFNINLNKNVHDIAAAVFAACFIIGIVFATVADIMKKDILILASGILIGIMAMIGWLAFPAGAAEMIGISCGVVWAIFQFIKYARDGVLSGTNPSDI